MSQSDVLKIQVKALRWFVDSHCGGVERVRGLSTAEVVETFIRPFVRRHENCPSDGTNLATLVWSEGLSSFGQPGPFISHSWGADFVELMETMESELRHDDFIWLDILCINVASANDSSIDGRFFGHVFYSTIRDCSSVIMINQCCSDPQPTTNSIHRLWCILEVWAALQTKADFKMLFTSSTKKSILADPDHWSRTLLSKPIGSEHAKCTLKHDTRVIMMQIETQLEAFNGSVEIKIRSELHRLLQELGVPVHEWADTMGKLQNKQMGIVVPPVSVLEGDLQKACKLGHVQEVHDLIQRGANLTAKDTDNNTALHIAAYSGHTPVVVLLLDRGADATARNEQGNTALHAAAFNGHAQTAQRLVEKGADLKSKNDQGASPLHVAAQRGHYSAAGILLACGAPVNAQDDWGATPLDVAKASENTKNTKQVQDMLKTHGGRSGKLGCKCTIA